MTALEALYTAVYTTLRGVPVWGDRVSPDYIPADVPLPAAVFFASSGGSVQRRQDRQAAQFTLTVKCISDNLRDSLDGAAAIAGALKDAGAQDKPGVRMVQPAGWIITTVTQRRAVHVVELYQGAEPVYHDGHEYVFVIEERIE